MSITNENDITTARKVQSDYDKNESAKKALQAQSLEKYQRQLAAFRAEKEKYDGATTKSDQWQPKTDPIQSYHIISQNYYLGYHGEYGVLVARRVGEVQVPVQFLGKREPMTIIEHNNKSFNNLTRSDFDAILKAKPSFVELEKAYNSTALMSPFDNILVRMNLNTATVVW